MKLPRIIATAALAAGLTVPVAALGATAASASAYRCASGGSGSYISGCFGITGEGYYVQDFYGNVTESWSGGETVCAQVIGPYGPDPLLWFQGCKYVPQNGSYNWGQTILNDVPGGQYCDGSWQANDPDHQFIICFNVG